MYVYAQIQYLLQFVTLLIGYSWNNFCPLMFYYDSNCCLDLHITNHCSCPPRGSLFRSQFSATCSAKRTILSCPRIALLKARSNFHYFFNSPRNNFPFQLISFPLQLFANFNSALGGFSWRRKNANMKKLHLMICKIIKSFDLNPVPEYCKALMKNIDWLSQR